MPKDLKSELSEWRARHRDEFAAERRPEFRTSSGRTIAGLYTPEDVAELDYTQHLGLPGEFPYTRGSTPSGYRGALWDWEFYAGFGGASDANTRYRYLIEQGGTGGVSIALDLPTQLGLDSDNPLAGQEVGVVGVAIDTLDDALAVFEGLSLSEIGKIFTTANCIGPIAFAWFHCLAEARGESPDSVTVTIQNDPLKDYVARGTQFLPVPAAVKLTADVIEHCAERKLPWYPISVSGAHMKQAGGSCAEEIAFTLANGLAYIDAVVERGMPVERFIDGVELHFSTDMDFFEEVAKYRVIRRVWSELLHERYGIHGVQPRLHAAASGATLTAQQPLNNIVRITLEVLAQVLGGVDQTRTPSYDEALAIPSEDAVKQSIRINQIIAHESGVADTVDPLGGSYFIERLTLDMYEEVREIISTIDELGGAIAAVESGYFAGRLADGAYRQQQDLEEGRRKIIGVTDFVEEEASIRIFKGDAQAAARQRERLAAFKASRSDDAVAEALARVRQDARDKRNSVPGVIEAVRVGATVGEICDVWRAEYGEWHATTRAA